MKAVSLVVSLLLASFGCRNPVASDAPYIRGVITDRDTASVGVRGSDGIIRVIEYPRILVEKDPSAPLWTKSPKSIVSWGVATEIKFSGAGSATEADLKIGQKVSVWVTDVVLASNPSQATATRIVIEKQS